MGHPAMLCAREPCRDAMPGVGSRAHTQTGIEVARRTLAHHIDGPVHELLVVRAPAAQHSLSVPVRHHRHVFLCAP